MSELVINDKTKAKDLRLITDEQCNAIAKTLHGSYSASQALFIKGFWSALALLSLPEDAETGECTIKEFAENAYNCAVIKTALSISSTK